MFESAQERILDLIFKYPYTRFSYRDIERKTGVSIGSVSKFVKQLSEKKIINIEIRPNAKYVSGNTSNPLFTSLKRINNMNSIMESGLVERLDRKLRSDAIILFGSFERGEDSEKSDIDICIVGGRKRGFNLKPYEKKLARQIDTIKYRPKRASRGFKNSIANGIVLKGYNEL